MEEEWKSEEVFIISSFFHPRSLFPHACLVKTESTVGGQVIFAMWHNYCNLGIKTLKLVHKYDN